MFSKLKVFKTTWHSQVEDHRGGREPKQIV